MKDREAMIDTCKLNAYRALAAARILRMHRSRPDWREDAAWQVDAAAASVRFAVRIRQVEAQERIDEHQRMIAAARVEPLAAWERWLLENPVSM